MKPYQALIFDMNGTIIDDMGFHTQAWLTILADLGHPVTADEFARQFYGKTNAETLREVLGSDISAAQLETIAHQKEIVYQRIYRPHLRPLAGFLPFLAAARQKGLPVALATSANQFNIDFTLAGLGLRQSFDAIISADDIENGKPHPEIFLKAAAALGVPAAACLVFEDSFMGLEAARRAGMAAFAILTTFTEAETRALPHVVGAAQNYEALPALLFAQGTN